jgi:hypothetical protein
VKTRVLNKRCSEKRWKIHIFQIRVKKMERRMTLLSMLSQNPQARMRTVYNRISLNPQKIISKRLARIFFCRDVRQSYLRLRLSYKNLILVLLLMNGF